MSSRPDLETEAGRAAYRRELRRVGWQLRAGGMGLIVVAAGLIMGGRAGTLGLTEAVAPIAYGLLAVGWVLWIVSIVQRTRYHKRRLQEGL